MGLIGNGNWAEVVSSEINKHSGFYLKAIITKSVFIPIKNCNELKYTNFEKIIKQVNFDCLYVAVNPFVNFEIFKVIKKYKIPCVFEKPIFDNIENCNELEKYLINTNHCLLTNLPNIYSEIFNILNNYINKNRRQIKKIHFYEGKKGKRNKNIHPLLDWGVHSLTLIFKLFKNQNVDSVNLKPIKLNINNMIYKIDLNINDIKIKILSGNGFKNKIRKLIIFLDNGEIYKFDFSIHKIFQNNSLIFTSKKTPISKLLDSLQKNLNYGHDSNDLENILVSLKAIKIFCKSL